MSSPYTVNPHRLRAVLAAALIASSGLPATALELVEIHESLGSVDTWLISDWPAGQSNITHWTPDNVAEKDDGTIVLTLDEKEGSDTIYHGGEIQSVAVAQTGVWTFDVQAPRMVDGAVFGLFLYRADWQNDPWREYDIEFVGQDTTQVQLNIHFETGDGKRVTLAEAQGGVVTVDLGFDAAQSVNRYSIEVQPEQVIFRVNDNVIGQFGPDDMPDGTWDTGPLKSFVDLWAAAPGQASWTGPWVYPGTPLTARVTDLTLPAGATVAP